MNIPLINSILGYLRGDGATILPEIELVLFGLGILVIDFWIDQKGKHLNAALALAGTFFSAFTLWRLRPAVAARSELYGFHESVVVDHFFLFFAILFLAATALVILLSVKYLEIEREQEGEYYALSFYVLTGFLRREKRSNEAALKYVLLGAFSSGILAYGFSLIYGLSGATNIRNIQAAFDVRSNLARVIEFSHQPAPMGDQAHQILAERYPAALQIDPSLLGHAPLLLVAAFVLVAVGLFFKIAAG